MKFEELCEALFDHDIQIPGLKRVWLRGKDLKVNNYGTTYADSSLAYKDRMADIIGWFTNKHNEAFGWTIFKLSPSDKIWFKQEKESTKDTYRVSSEKGTSLVRFNLKKGTMCWFDNSAYEEDDRMYWEKYVPYRKVLVDSGCAKYFGVESQMKKELKKLGLGNRLPY